MGSILDNGSFVCFMAIALAGLGVLMAYAIFSRFSPKPSMEKNVGANGEYTQAQYMRDVRLRYQGSMANANGYGRKWLQMTADHGAGMGGGHGHGHRDSEASYV